MTREDAWALLGTWMYEPAPKELPPAEAEWVKETAQLMFNSRMEGESAAALVLRMQDPHLKDGQRKFPECRWLLIFLVGAVHDLCQSS